MALVDAQEWYALLATDGTTRTLRRIARPDYGAVANPTPPSPPPSTPDRSALVYGTYEPDSSVTGVIAGSILTDYNSPSTNSYTVPDGASYISKRVHGDLRFSGAASFNNCLIDGGALAATGDTACIFNDHPAAGKQITFTDCTIIPQNPSNARNCFLGRQAEFYRCYFALGIDCIGVRSVDSAHPSCDFVMKGCWAGNMSFWCDPNSTGTSTPPIADPIGNHIDGTHSDVIQHQGGQNVTIVGNALYGTCTKLPGSRDLWGKEWMSQAGWSSGACLLVQNNVGSWGTIDATTLVTDNYIYGGGAGSQFNCKTSATGMQYKNNHHYRATAVGAGWSGYWIRFQNYATTTVAGINGTPTNTNVWIDGPYAGTAMVTPRDHGVETTGN
jgi:hypothetical protein